MKIVISGDRSEGKTTLMRLIGSKMSGMGWDVTVVHSFPIEPFTPEEDGKIRPRSLEIVEEQSSQEVWDGMIEASKIGSFRRREDQ